MRFFDTVTAMLGVGSLHLVVFGLTRSMAQPANDRRPGVNGRVTQQMNEPRIHALARFDAVTNLPNQRFFADRLVAMARAGQAPQGHYALLLVALDAFTDDVGTMDTIGGDARDEVLRLAAVRIIRRVRESDFVARLDDFTYAVVLAGIERPADATQVATDLQTLLGMPFMVAGRELRFTVSIGVALAPQHGEDAETLLDAATTAFHVIEGRGTGGIRFASE